MWCKPSSDGLVQAFVLTEAFLAVAHSTLVLGDNIFFGHGPPKLLVVVGKQTEGGTVFGYHVADPNRYGAAAFDADRRAKENIESRRCLRRTMR